MNGRGVSLPFGIASNASRQAVASVTSILPIVNRRTLRHHGIPSSDFSHGWLSEGMGLSPQNMVLYKEMRSGFAKIIRVSFFL